MPKIYAQDGNVTRSAYDEPDGTFHLYVEQDLEDAIEENKALAENQTGKEMFRLAARVPVPVVEKAMIEGWFHDDDAWKKWMNDGDNRDFRVWGGRI